MDCSRPAHRVAAARPRPPSPGSLLPHHSTGPRPAPLSSGVYCIVALSHCCILPLPHRQHHKPRKPHKSQESATSSSCVLRYLDFRPDLGTDLRDIAAQYSSDLIKGVNHRTRDIRPLSSGVSHVPAFPPTPGMPRPLEPQEHQKPLEHQDSLEPQGSRPVCCDIGVFGPHFSPHSEKTQHTPRRSATRHEPPCRERGVARQEATSPHLCVLRYRANQVPSPAQNSNIAAQYSTRQPNQPPPHPPTLQKCSTQRVNVIHPSSVLRFLRFSGRHKPQQPDIAAHTASGRGEVAQVRRGA